MYVACTHYLFFLNSNVTCKSYHSEKNVWNNTTEIYGYFVYFDNKHDNSLDVSKSEHYHD